MRRTISLFIAIVFFLTAVNGQQRRVDSLLKLNNSYHQEDSLKAIYLRELFRAYYSVKNYAKTDQYIDSAILMAARLPRKNILAFAYYRAGGSNHNRNRLMAIIYYNKAIETAKLSNISTNTEAGANLNLGALYMDIQDYPKSLEAHEKALALFGKLHDEGGISSCLMNMSYIYINMGQKVKGLEYIKRALKVFDDSNTPRGIAVAYEEILDLYFNATDSELTAMGVAPANRYKEIAAGVDKGQKNALLTEDTSVIAGYYKFRGMLNERMGNLKAAEQNYTKAIETNQDILEDSYGNNLVAAGNFYINKQNDLSKGLGMLQKALIGARKANSPGTEQLVLEALSDAHEKARNFDSALIYYRQLIVVKDAIFNKEKEQEITRRQLKIDFDLKERDYKNTQQLADARLKQQEQQILLRNQQLLISDKEKTLQRLTFLQKQAELENQKKLQANQLVQQQQKSEYDKKTRDQQIDVQNVQLVSNKRLSAFLGILAVIVFAVAMFIYNSRRKTLKLARVVSEQKVELEELVAVKDKIFSVVSHDMRTPMNNIIAFSSLLEDGDIEQERLSLYVDQIKGTLEHTSSLMENMLNWAASQMQGFTPVIEQVNMSAVIAHTLQGAEQAILKKKLSLNNTVGEKFFVKADKNMLELIMRNLVNNAVKFSNINGLLELAVHSKEDKIIVSVTDNGVGMIDAKVALINNTSSTAIQSTTGTAKEKGTGLGLMLCKHFAALMHGKIQVESKIGNGSVFKLILPAAQA